MLSITAFTNKDRRKLLSLTLPIYKKLKERTKTEFICVIVEPSKYIINITKRHLWTKEPGIDVFFMQLRLKSNTAIVIDDIVA